MPPDNNRVCESDAMLAPSDSRGSFSVDPATFFFGIVVGGIIAYAVGNF